MFKTIRFFFFLCVGASIHAAVTRNDWEVFPMTEAKVQIPLDLMYTKQEFASIVQGFIPRDMDDRWVIITEKEHIFFYRSWTGVMIYDCSFEERDEGVLISSMYVNRNPNEYKNKDNENDVLQVTYLLYRMFSQNP